MRLHLALSMSVLAICATANAQLVVRMSAPKITGQKVVVPLAMKNSFTEKVESARAVVFLFDERGEAIGQATRWVIDGSNTNGLPAGATNAFNFVINSDKPSTSTNLTAKVQFTRVVLEGGKLADGPKDVHIQNVNR